MNLRFTKFKVIASIVIPILVWILFAVLKNVKSGFINKIVSFHDYTNLLSTHNLIVFLVEIVVVYLILSIFHRKFY